MKRLMILGILGAFVFCGALTAAPAPGLGTKKINVSYAWTNNIPDKKGFVTQELEKLFNFNIEIVSIPSTEEATKLNLMLASDSLPDVFHLTQQLVDVANKGTAAFGLDAFKQYMPLIYDYHVMKMKDLGYNPNQTWARYTDSKGVVNRVPQVWPAGMAVRSMMWRLDILETLGKKVPTTIAEMEDVLKAFKAKWPAKYPLNACGKYMLQAFTAVLNSCGKDFWRTNLKDGKIVYDFVQPEVKEPLEILARWYKLGYIDPAWVSATQPEKISSFINGESIMYDWYPVVPTDPPLILNQYPDQITKLNPSARLVLGPVMRLKDGVKPAAPASDAYHGGAFAFNRNLLKDLDKLHRVMDFCDKTFGDEEISTLCTYGVKDVHFKVNPDGSYSSLPGAVTADERKTFNLRYYGSFPDDGGISLVRHGTTQRMLDLNAKVFAPGGILDPATYVKTFERTKGPVTDPAGTDLGKKYMVNLMAKAEEMVASIITGAKGIGAFDDWVKYWKANGGTELEQNANRLYGGLY